MWGNCTNVARARPVQWFSPLAALRKAASGGTRLMELPMKHILLVSLFLCVPVVARADAFDNYTLPILQKVPESAGVKEVAELTPELILANSQVVPNVEGALIVVATNDNHWAKLLVSAARHKHMPMPGAEPEFVPILRIERYVTFREASERAVLASGQGLSLFPGFHLNLDLGQVVPEKLGGDLAASEPKPKVLVVKPVGKAKIYLVTKPLPEAAPQKTQKLEVGEKFEAAYFNGAFKLYADGRRSGVLRLKVG